MSHELDDQVYSRIVQLCKAGDTLAEQGDYSQALEKYQEAFELIPDPFTDWEASTWILTVMGETLFFQGDFAEAREALRAAMHCPGAIGNPYIHLRLGQAQFEMGNVERARDELVRAYMGGGEEIFQYEDAKYFDLVKASIILPG